MYRKGVSALIINSKSEFLLVNLQSFEEKYYAIPGGGIDEGETAEDTVYREINEELGITKDNLKLLGKCKNPLKFKFKEIKLSRDGKKYTGSERTFFALKFIGSESDIKINTMEVRKYKWVSYKDLKDYLLFDNQLDETTDKIKELFLPFR